MNTLSDRLGDLSPQKRELLLRRLRQSRSEGADLPVIRRRIAQDKHPLSHAQRRLWFLDQLEPGKASYNIPAALRFTGALDASALERSLNEIVRRHEALRATFVAVKDDVEQIISPALDLNLKTTDLRSLPEEEREREASERASAEARIPFDLARGPLIRASLLRLGQTEHILILVMSHIVADGWSAGVFLRELASLYQAYAAGRPSPLAELPIQYADFARWQQEEQITGDLLAAQIAYWTKQLSGAPTALELPSDRPRPPIQTHNGESLTITLPRLIASEVAAFSQREGVTSFVTLLAAFQTLLSRYTGQEDLCVGVPVANRRHTELDGLIGFFANTLVMRADLTGEPSFRELTRRTLETHLAADERQDLPFETLIAAMQPARDLSRTPLFQVMFAYQQPPTLPDLPGLSIRPMEIETGAAKFDLLLTTEPGPDGLRTIWEYNTDIFDRTTIARMAGHYQTLLTAAMADPDLPVSRLPILTQPERRRILYRWNDTEVAYHPRACLLHHLFEEQVRRAPHSTALIYQDQRLSYCALNRRANQLAARLRRIGVGPESLVAVSMERSIEMVVALYAILKAGGAYVPIDPANPPQRLAFMLEDVNPPALLTQSRLIGRLPRRDAEVICLDAEWDRLAKEDDNNFDSGATEENLAYAIYTSGSTGHPKCALIPHQGICNRLLWMQDQYQLTSEDCVLQKTPFSFDVSVWEFFWPLLAGARLVVARPEGHKDTDYLIELIKREQITTIHFVPSMLQAFLENERASECRSLRRVICSGEALSFDLQQRFFERMDTAELHNLYGPTEASVDVSFWACQREGKLKTVPIGRPIANTQLYILDRHLQPVPVGVPGELHIGGVGVGRGYLNRTELTAEKFIELRIADRDSGNGERPTCDLSPSDSDQGIECPSIRNSQSAIRVYKTGDLCRFLPDGAIEYLGRLDHQVKIRGFRIELGEIEAALTAHPAIRKAVVIAREDRGDKQLVAYYAPEEAPGPAASELRAYLKDKLPDYMVPAAMVAMETLPLSSNGKLDRRALPAPDKTDMANESSYSAPRTPVEEMIAGMWAELLGIERVGVHDNFFDLGGHSLLATRLVSRIRDAFDAQLPLRALFEEPTVAELAARVEAARADDVLRRTAPPITPAPREGHLPLSYAQQRLWFLHQLEPESSFYNIPAFVRLRGQLDVAALEQSLNQCVRRHEAMRTVFPDVDGKPAQLIQPPQPVKLRVTDLNSMEERDRIIQRLGEIEMAQPFDLAKGPLWRAHLLRVAEDEHVLFLVLHHIIADGWAIRLLVEEVGQLYTAFSQGQPSPLPDLPIQYADYARWQRDWMQGETLERQLDYWRGQLSAAPAHLNLPADHPRPPMQTYNGAVQSFTLPANLADRCRAIGRQEGATLFMIMLAAFQTLLHRYSGQEIVNVGAPVANRTRSEVERLLGCFVNTLVIKADFTGAPTFREALRRVREAALGAYMHQDIPFEALVDALGAARDLTRSPLFQVMFMMNDRSSLRLSLPQLSLEGIEPGRTTAKFDLTLEMWEEGDTLSGAIEYNTDLFEAETINRMIGHFQTMLASLAADPDQSVAAAPLLTEAEQRQILLEWNRTEADFPADQCVHHLFEAQVARAPENIAVEYDGRRLSYRELNERANQLAAYLRELGVGPDTLVGVSVERSPEMIIGLLGILKAGGAYVPMDPSYPAERLAWMLSDSAPLALLTQERLIERLPHSDAQVICLDKDWPAISVRSVENLDGGAGAGNLAYVIYTSGSTGRPKGTLIEHRGVVNYLTWCERAYPISEGAGSVTHSSISFDLTVTSLFAPLAAGKRVKLVREDLGVEALAEALREESDLSLVKITPAHLKLLGQQLEPKEAAGRTRAFVIGGENLLPEHIAFWREHAPETKLINEYGPTETVVGCCVYQAPQGKQNGRVIPIGRPIINTKLFILDANRQPVPVGVVGELYIGGAGVGRGYLNRPDLTAEKFIELRIADWGMGNSAIPNPQSAIRVYKTGDLARYLPDGNIECLGRSDDQVKIRGYRVELGEIESVLERHRAVSAAAVVARTDEAGGKRLAAYVALNQPEESSADELRAYLQAQLPEYMTPTWIMALEALPLTPNGKVDRRALPAPEQARNEMLSEYAAPRSSVEETLVEIWRQVLGVANVGIHDNFFALGGDSILSIQVISRARQAGIQLMPKQLFEHPTVSGLAAVAGTNVEIEAEQGLVTGLTPLTPIQRWFFDQELPEAWHWNQAALLEAPGGMKRELLEATVARLLEHHDALRMRYHRPHVEDGVWIQTNAENSATDLKEVCRWFDFAGMSGSWQTAAVTRHADVLQASLNLTEGPLLQVAYFDLGPRRAGRLLIAIHHLVVDGVSWRILMEDLQTIYAQLDAGQTPKLPPKTTSFRQWAQRLVRYAESEEARRELPYWRAATDGGLARLPVDFPGGANTEGSAASVVVELNEAETAALLQEAPAAYGTEINDALLTALARALDDWAGGATLVNVEGHGREEIIPNADISRTVGWFTTQFPVRLEWKTAESPGEALLRIKEQLRRIPNRGIGYGILKYLSGQSAPLDLAPQAEVGFNYLGQFDQTLPSAGLFALASESAGLSRSLRGDRACLIEINGGVSGGKLQLEWSYSNQLHRRETIERVAQKFIAVLRELIAHCQSPEAAGYTPSDFPDVDLSEEQLKALIQGIGSAAGMD